MLCTPLNIINFWAFLRTALMRCCLKMQSKLMITYKWIFAVFDCYEYTHNISLITNCAINLYYVFNIGELIKIGLRVLAITFCRVVVSRTNGKKPSATFSFTQSASINKGCFPLTSLCLKSREPCFPIIYLSFWNIN